MESSLSFQELMKKRKEKRKKMIDESRDFVSCVKN